MFVLTTWRKGKHLENTDTENIASVDKMRKGEHLEKTENTVRVVRERETF